MKQVNIGDVRIRRGFLFFPKTIEGETRWLKWAKWQEEAVPTVTVPGEKSWFWMEEKWL